jgi:SAM-dependent methyltransferase
MRDPARQGGRGSDTGPGYATLRESRVGRALGRYSGAAWDWGVNLFHRWYCRSAGWTRRLYAAILPTALAGLDLGDYVLELGPGPGLSTAWLCRRVPRLMALELEPGLAAAARRRLAGSNAIVVEGDATAMPFPDASFSAVLCFTMLHHVPSPALQDRLLAEAHRVLEPGGWFAGSDGLPTPLWNLMHVFDTRTPVDPATFEHRLTAAGFEAVRLWRMGNRLFFRARRPA